MQQFLIPSSTGSSQIINIPVSLLSQSSQQPISFITANGQIFQIPSFSQLVVHQNSDGTTSTSGGGATQGGGQNSVGGGGGVAQLTAAGGASSSATASTAQGATNAAGQQQTLVINHQGQLISLPVLQPSAGGGQRVATAGGNAVSVTVANAANNGTTPIKTLLEEDEKSDTNSIDDQGPTIANIPTASSGPAGLSHNHPITHATTVDGVNLDEIREFAKAFKLRRLALGLTQTQVGQALSATKGPAYSQSAICRFEKLDITPKSAAKIKPVLEKWMQEAELKYADRLKTGSHQNFADLLGTENTKKRKRRTSFTPQALEILNEYFEKNTHPSGSFEIGNQGADMTMLAQKLNYDREVIRVWFCNKRQALKNSLKKLKQNESQGGMESSDHSDAESPLNTSLPSISNNNNTTTNNNSSQQIIVTSSNQQPQVISVVQSALDSASQANAGVTELTVIKQEATNNHANSNGSAAKTVVTLSSGGATTNNATSNGGSSSASNSSNPETDVNVLLVVNAVAAGSTGSTSSSSSSANNNNNSNNNTNNNNDESSSAAAGTTATDTSAGTNEAANTNGASSSAQASNSTTSVSTANGSSAETSGSAGAGDNQ